MTEVIICCGVGGTGKTTTAAAMGLGLARAGKRVVVLTIDPARRLADALSMEALGNSPTSVPLRGVDGTLDAMMLDRKGTWDSIIHKFARTPETAERLLVNPYYRAVSTRLTGSHEYMAIEKLYELVELDRWDIVVVDTPPAQHVLDFFKAPERVRRVFDRSVLTRLEGPENGLWGGARRRAAGLVQRVVGHRVLDDIREFFSLVGDMAGGFRDRSTAVAELLVSPSTHYFLVADARAPQRNDLIGFLGTLQERDMHFAGFLVNRVTTSPQHAGTLRPGDLWPGPEGVEAQVWEEAVARLLALPRSARRRAAADLAGARALSERAGDAPVWMLPEIPGGVRSLQGLARVARALPPRATPSLGRVEPIQAA